MERTQRRSNFFFSLIFIYLFISRIDNSSNPVSKADSRSSKITLMLKRTTFKYGRSPYAPWHDVLNLLGRMIPLFMRGDDL